MIRERGNSGGADPAEPPTIAALVDEYNGILTVICAYTTLVSAELTPWNPCQRDLDEINVSVRRAAEITRRLARLAAEDAPDTFDVRSH